MSDNRFLLSSEKREGIEKMKEERERAGGRMKWERLEPTVARTLRLPMSYFSTGQGELILCTGSATTEHTVFTDQMPTIEHIVFTDQVPTHIQHTVFTEWLPLVLGKKLYEPFKHYKVPISPKHTLRYVLMEGIPLG
eukprot:1337210-Amorphochlora_amoeboformis.AAC.1